MLLRVGSCPGHYTRDVNYGNKGKSWVSVDDRNQVTAGAVLRKIYHAAGGRDFIAAEVAAGRVGERSSIR
jgi:hypothetical protein